MLCLQYFQLLSNGVILRDVKKKMEQDGADPEILEMYQYKRIHISEEDMVLRGEHAKVRTVRMPYVKPTT